MKEGIRVGTTPKSYTKKTKLFSKASSQTTYKEELFYDEGGETV